MARPREFDRDTVLERAMSVFWTKGYAAASTEELVQAMGIGRQSLYAAFGDKWRLYVEALERYQQESVAGHLHRLRSGASAIAGVEALLVGLIPVDEEARRLGCMGRRLGGGIRCDASPAGRAARPAAARSSSRRWSSDSVSLRRPGRSTRAWMSSAPPGSCR